MAIKICKRGQRQTMQHLRDMTLRNDQPLYFGVNCGRSGISVQLLEYSGSLDPVGTPRSFQRNEGRAFPLTYDRMNNMCWQLDHKCGKIRRWMNKGTRPVTKKAAAVELPDEENSGMLNCMTSGIQLLETITNGMSHLLPFRIDRLRIMSKKLHMRNLRKALKKAPFHFMVESGLVSQNIFDILLDMLEYVCCTTAKVCSA